MRSIYENCVKQYKSDYIMMGALVVMVGVLKDIFEDHFSVNFLIGISLFALSMLFLNILFKILIQFYKEPKPKINTFFYIISFSIFVITFFIASYSTYTLSFGIFLAIFFAFITLRIIILLRAYFIVFQKKFKKRWFKILLRIGFLIILILLWSSINNIVLLNFDTVSFAEKVSSEVNFKTITQDEWSSYVFLLVNTFFFAVGCLMGFLDLFKKEPIGHRNFIWKKTYLYLAIRWIKQGGLKKFGKKFYSYYLE